MNANDIKAADKYNEESRGPTNVIYTQPINNKNGHVKTLIHTNTTSNSKLYSQTDEGFVISCLICRYLSYRGRIVSFSDLVTWEFTHINRWLHQLNHVLTFDKEKRKPALWASWKITYCKEVQSKMNRNASVVISESCIVPSTGRKLWTLTWSWMHAFIASLTPPRLNTGHTAVTKLLMKQNGIISFGYRFELLKLGYHWL